MDYKWTVLTVTTVGVIMAGIDDRIVIVGLPQVAAALHADAEQAIWFTQSYALSSTIFLLLIGRVTDMWGRIKVYNIGFIIFTIGSALTSLSLNPTEVIMFRAVQGLGASMLFTNSAALIVDSTPARELGLHLGINSLAFRIGAMSGLTLSGLILAFLDWRALFYINVPIGIFGTIWAYKRLKEVAQLEKGVPFDWLGFVTFTLCITSFLLMLTYAAYGLAETDLVIALGLIGVGTLIVFVRYESKRKFPLLDLDLLRIREFTGGVMAQMLNAITWGSMLLLLSLFLQLVQNQTPLQAGLELLPYEFAFLAVGPLSGTLSDRYGPRSFATTGLVVMSLALVLMATMDPGTPYLTIVYYEIIMGVGIGLFASPRHELGHGRRAFEQEGHRIGVQGAVLQHRLHHLAEPFDAHHGGDHPIPRRLRDNSVVQPSGDIGRRQGPLFARPQPHLCGDGHSERRGDHPIRNEGEEDGDPRPYVADDRRIDRRTLEGILTLAWHRRTNPLSKAKPQALGPESHRGSQADLLRHRRLETPLKLIWSPQTTMA